VHAPHCYWHPLRATGAAALATTSSDASVASTLPWQAQQQLTTHQQQRSHTGDAARVQQRTNSNACELGKRLRDALAVCAQSRTKKRRKQQLEQEALLQALEEDALAHSKSHTARVGLAWGLIAHACSSIECGWTGGSRVVVNIVSSMHTAAILPMPMFGTVLRPVSAHHCRVLERRQAPGRHMRCPALPDVDLLCCPAFVAL
jgi:hypothetical protein